MNTGLHVSAFSSRTRSWLEPNIDIKALSVVVEDEAPVAIVEEDFVRSVFRHETEHRGLPGRDIQIEPSCQQVVPIAIVSCVAD